MKPEEFEVYVIPPNFMEGGTLFGGLLKTRNTIEAVILGLAVGVPVLHLPFSITVRVVILCLTALPLVLLALIGVSGMSLSAFIRLFFCFLHNRRILSRDGTQGGKNGKTLLPSWAQQRKSDCVAEDPPLPKSRSRFSVDLKQRSVTQFKTFLQEEEAVQPLNALADYIPIEKIEHGVIYTRDHRYVKVVEVVPVNFLLRSAREQRSIIYSFISYLKIAPVKVQFKALTKRADINRHLETVRRELEHEQDPRCRVLQEDYLKLIRQLGSRGLGDVYKRQPVRQSQGAFFSFSSMSRCPAPNAAMRKRMQSLLCKQPHARRQIICGSAATRSFPLRTRMTPRRRFFITFSAAGPAVSHSTNG